MIRAATRRHRRPDSIAAVAATSRREQALAELQAAHRACTRCADAGLIPHAHPVFSGSIRQRVLLVGQAPGPVEMDQTRPFAGRAGRQLMRWMQRAGFDGDADVRARVYMTAMTTCFPGRRPDGAGDRRPSGREVALCAPWLDSLIPLLRPRLLLPVGSLALQRFLPGRRLADVIGFAYTLDGHRVRGAPASAPVILPLPHPSGQSRWLNDPSRAALLDAALRRLAMLVRWADATGDGGESGSEPML